MRRYLFLASELPSAAELREYESFLDRERLEARLNAESVKGRKKDNTAISTAEADPSALAPKSRLPEIYAADNAAVQIRRAPVTKSMFVSRQFEEEHLSGQGPKAFDREGN